MTATNPPVRSVFDCNVLLQAMANPNGPAGACIAEVKADRIQLFISPAIFSELTEVAARFWFASSLYRPHARSPLSKISPP